MTRGVDIITSTGEFRLAQRDGGLPTTLAAGAAPGESGVSVLNVRFIGGLHLARTPRSHVVCFQLGRARFDCRIGGRILQHHPAAGSLAVCPADMDCAADADRGVDAVLVTIDPRQLALAAAEDSGLQAQLVERLSGHDPALLHLARTLAVESSNGYPNGPLFWNEKASGFIAGLLVRHTARFEGRARGSLGKDTLRRLREYILAHLQEPIAVAALAEMAGRSPFYFSRVFTRSVGVTPHRYIVHLRLQRAIELVRGDRSGLAEIAARTGFADQSHLSRWVRRVHGVSLTQLVV
jgi:AraC family transcriptional regulator